MKKIGWMGEFIDPVMELTFRKSEWNGFRKRMIFASLVGGTAYFLAIIGDFLTITSEPMFRNLLIMRSSVLLIALAVSLLGILHKKHTRALNIGVCVLLFSVLFGESGELAIKGEIMDYVGIPAMPVLILLFYLSFPPRFIWILAVCLIGCATFSITSILLGHASPEYIYTTLLYFIVVNVFGAYVYLQFSIMRRREYSSLEELKRNAEIDGLTQIYNRRKVLALGDDDIDNANNCGHEYSIIMIDVDNFKSVNDTYGHAVGDEVLLDVARRCRNALRDDDILGRFGGEEFVVFLPKTNLNDAFIIGERLRSEISDTPFKTTKTSLLITISLGVAALTKAKETPRKLLEMADQALYTAKETGKNKIVNNRPLVRPYC
ncbi:MULTISPECIES: GGDEF domain-containing protein [Vibrio]|uniref:GGDEF domain-containing protein n=1 Tax=Vibrio TaxID=662 RepID=UPI001080DFDC|nr:MULTISPECIES: GGDEF domain-containing protein [Vibrio]MCF7503589.1 GGDEF domain-containing protein [Vibrio sp. L3-7]TVU74783.1 GGDEF domain-containing protein [Vibrio tasmaniensis]